jgi:hypothetical protein
MEPRVEPHRGITVDPTRTMTNTGIKTVFDLRNMGSGESLDTSIEIGKKTLAVVRDCDQIVLNAIQHEGFTGALV